jgi:hypothetical protein
MKSKYHLMKLKTLKLNQLVIFLCIRRGSAGEKICCFARGFINNPFLYYFLQSPIFIEIFITNTNGIIGCFSIKKIKEMIIPIPPFDIYNLNNLNSE